MVYLRRSEIRADKKLLARISMPITPSNPELPVKPEALNAFVAIFNTCMKAETAVCLVPGLALLTFHSAWAKAMPGPPHG